MCCFPGGFPLEYAATKTVWGLQNIDHSLLFMEGGGGTSSKENKSLIYGV